MIISDDLVVRMKPARKAICLTAKIRQVVTVKAVFKSCKKAG